MSSATLKKKKKKKKKQKEHKTNMFCLFFFSFLFFFFFFLSYCLLFVVRRKRASAAALGTSPNDSSFLMAHTCLCGISFERKHPFDEHQMVCEAFLEAPRSARRAKKPASGNNVSAADAPIDAPFAAHPGATSTPKPIARGGGGAAAVAPAATALDIDDDDQDDENNDDNDDDNDDQDQDDDDDGVDGDNADELSNGYDEDDGGDGDGDGDEEDEEDEEGEDDEEDDEDDEDDDDVMRSPAPPRFTAAPVVATCPICNTDLSHLPNEEAAHLHVNQCLGADAVDEALSHEQRVFAANPFAVLCPFDGCNRVMEAADFFAHAPVAHAEAKLLCPLCALQGTDIVVRLLAHLKASHSSLLGRGKPNNYLATLAPKQRASPAAKKAAVKGARAAAAMAAAAAAGACIVCGRTDECDCGVEVVHDISMSAELAARTMVNETLVCSLGSECIICFEELGAGQEVTRMGCMCVFHSTCIKLWFDRSKVNVCPTHQGNL
jgi:hypothetical protein